MKKLKKIGLLCATILASGTMIFATGCFGGDNSMDSSIDEGSGSSVGSEIVDDTSSDSNSESSNPEVVTYTIKFVDENGDILQEGKVEEGALPVYNGQTPTKASNAQYSYVFAGWNTEVVVAVADTTYTATYTESVNNYTVSFNTDGGSLIEEQTVPYGTSATELSAFTSTKVGYTFAGWTLEDGSAIPEGASVTENITVKAVWTANTDTAYVVKHYQQNIADDEYTEVTVDAENMTGTTATATVAVAKTYEGFTAKTFEQMTIAADGSTVVAIYYDRNTYTVSFNTDGGSMVADQIVRYGTSADALAAFTSTKAGHTFIGWTLEDGAEITADTIVTDNITVKAAWGDYIQFAGTGKANAYQIGTFVIAETEYEEATYVNVTLKIRLSGTMFESKSLWTRYLSGVDTWTQLTPANNTAALETYKDFAEVTFKAYVPAGGNIELDVRNNSGVSADYCVQVKDVVIEPVEELEEGVIEYAGAGKANAYQIGTFTIAETDYAEGTYVNVTLKIKMSGSIFEAKSLWTRYLSEADTWVQLTAPNTAALETYKDFAEVTFKAYVPADGKIQLDVRNSAGKAGDYCIHVKEVAVEAIEETEEEIIEYSGTGKANTYLIGTFTIAETDYVEGTYVNVTLKIKLSGAMFESKSLWTRYLSGAGTWTELTAPNTAALETYKDFAEVTFKGYVGADGKIQLEVRNSSGKSAAYCVQVKDVVVTPAQ